MQLLKNQPDYPFYPNSFSHFVAIAFKYIKCNVTQDPPPSFRYDMCGNILASKEKLATLDVEPDEQTLDVNHLQTNSRDLCVGCGDTAADVEDATKLLWLLWSHCCC